LNIARSGPMVVSVGFTPKETPSSGTINLSEWQDRHRHYRAKAGG
jgi:hypothetical protein